jgi:repressor LexA
MELLNPIDAKAFRFIRNQLVHFNRSPSIREIQIELKYRSPRSAAVVVERLINSGWLARRADGKLRVLREVLSTRSHAQTILVPLVGTAACGAPLLAEENIEAEIPVTTDLAKPGHRYFLLRAKGNSMDQAAIADGDLVLVRQQNIAENGQIVVALIDDEATIKELHRTQTAVVLKPRSSSSEHQPIILTRDFQIQGIVVTAISNFE